MADRHNRVGNPKSTAEKLLEAREQDKQNNAIRKEQEAQYKESLNSIAKSEHGKFVLRALIGASGVFEPVNTGDAQSLLKANERNVYLKLIRPYLDAVNKQELER